MDRLYEKLTAYSREDYYPMHMPGHKRNRELLLMDNPYAIDITEIEGFDNLHQPEGILKDLSYRLSRLYGAMRSYPLVGGSTVGILAGISSAVHRGDKILIARNSHKAVYHAAVLLELEPVYCYPQNIDETAQNGGISASDIEDLLILHKDLRLVVITSPTYEGMVSDIYKIADTVHRYGALLLVDEAHGAHFGFHRAFPKSAVELGADMVIQSLHKTLPSFTQTAVLHCNREELNHKLRKYLAIYQSSSPSYLLLAGIDRCVSLLEHRAEELFETYYQQLTEFEKSLRDMKHLRLIGKEVIGKHGICDFDISKLTILVKNTSLTGHRLHEILRTKYHIVMEMEAPDYVLGMTSIADTREGFDRLREALLNIEQELTDETCVTNRNIDRKKENDKEEVASFGKPLQMMIPATALELQSETVKLADSAGRISAAFVALFPPGSPILVPGEKIDDKMISYLYKIKRVGIAVTGLSGNDGDEIDVLSEISCEYGYKSDRIGKDSGNG